MSFSAEMKTIMCLAYTNNINKLSLHTASPGGTGENDSEITHVDLSWSAPDDGVSTAQVEFTDLVGVFTHIGLWDDAAFQQGLRVGINCPAPADIAIIVTHEAGDVE